MHEKERSDVSGGSDEYRYPSRVELESTALSRETRERLERSTQGTRQIHEMMVGKVPRLDRRYRQF